jgi:hypothetical protein
VKELKPTAYDEILKLNNSEGLQRSPQQWGLFFCRNTNDGKING